MSVPDRDHGDRSGAALRVVTTPPWRGETVNPYRKLLYREVERLGTRVEDHSARRLLTERFDVWHVHWISVVYAQPTPLRRLLRALWFLALVQWQRARGAVIVWTLHDLDDNDQRDDRVSRWFIDRFVRRVDGLVALTEVGVGMAHRRHPVLARRPHAVVRIGTYRDAHGPLPARAAARRELGIPAGARVLVSVGLIRRFKDVPALARAFAGLDDPEAVLVVAGRPVDDEAVAELEAVAAADERIRLDVRYVPDDVVARYLASADAVVNPAPAVHNSSSVMLGLAAGVPVLAADSPTMRELRELVGEQWLHLFPGAVGTADVARVLAAATPGGDGPPLAPFEWSELARATVAFYRELVASKRPRRRRRCR